MDKPYLDFTQPASINNNYDISGKTAPDIALAHGHQKIAQMLDKRMSEQLETKKFEQDKELAHQKKEKARETRETLLAEETPQFGQLKVNVLHRYLGIKGVK